MNGRIRSRTDQQRIPLTARWSIQRIDASAPARTPAADGWMPIDGPSTVAGVLRAAGRWSLEAPARDFDADDWLFRAEFEVPATSAPVSRRDVEFGGLAGRCEVDLDDRRWFASDNMHVVHRVPAPPLEAGVHTLVLCFASLGKWLAVRRPRPRWRAPMVAHQQLRWARVSLLGRTPGWSPPAAAVGPWRGVHWLEGERVDVGDLRLRVRVADGCGLVDLEIDLASAHGGAAVGSARLDVARDAEIYTVPITRGDPSSSRHRARLVVPQPALWWPHTHGGPVTYTVAIVVGLEGQAVPIRLELGRIGFRTVVVDTADGDFAVRVNGVQVFCRGACWTPLDAVSLSATPAAITASLEQMRDCGLNMLRVSGSMVYEQDAFYDACDELGILVWQDFMFANMDYPDGDPELVASVIEEATQQLARWQARPSIAILCGNSEVGQQAAMWGAGREAWSSPPFERLLAELAGRCCPDVFFWPSSAFGGAFPHQNDVGTTSYYGVGAYLRPLEDARRSRVRFATECLAFANVPYRETIGRIRQDAPAAPGEPAWKARTPRDLGADWDFEDVRDHYVQRLLGVDPAALRESDPGRYLALGRATGAEVMQAAFSEWRRPASSCRGALVWFLRDLWPGAGWGLLDDRGRPKAALHGARRAWAPIAVFLSDEGTNGLGVHLVNDHAEALAAEVELAVFAPNGRRLRSAVEPHTIAAHSAISLAAAQWFDEFLDLSRAYRFGPSEFSMVVAILRHRSGRELGRAFHFPEALSTGFDGPVGLQARTVDLGDGCFEVHLQTERPARSVNFDLSEFAAQDDCFHLAPDERRRILLYPTRPGAVLEGSVGALNDPLRVPLEAAPDPPASMT